MKNKFLIIFAVMLALSPLLLTIDSVYATNGEQPIGDGEIEVTRDYGRRNSLTDIFRNNSMRGNDRMLARLGFIPWITQFVVTFVGLASNAQIIIRTLITVLYLSFRNFWDMVHEVHEQGLAASPPSWTDKLVWAVMWIMPDFQAYSDYGGRSNLNINQDDDLMQYLLKIAPKTIIVITISTMAYNGSYALMFAEVADALDTMAASSGTLKLTEKVKHIIDSGDRYKFAWEGSNNPLDRFYASNARSIYGRAVNVADLTDPNDLATVGSFIESQLPAKVRIERAESNPEFVQSITLGDKTIYTAGANGAFQTAISGNPHKLRTANTTTGLTVPEAVSQIVITTVNRPKGYVSNTGINTDVIHLFSIQLGDSGHVEVNAVPNPIEVKR